MSNDSEDVYYSLEDLKSLVTMDDYSSLFKKITDCCRWYIELNNMPMKIKMENTEMLGDLIFTEDQMMPNDDVYVSGIIQLSVIPYLKEVSIYELIQKIDFGSNREIFSKSELKYYDSESPKIKSDSHDILKPIIEDNEELVYMLGFLTSTKKTKISNRAGEGIIEFYMVEPFVSFLSGDDENLIETDLLFCEQNNRYSHLSKVDQSKLRFSASEVLKCSERLLFADDFNSINTDLQKREKALQHNKVKVNVKGKKQQLREEKLQEFVDSKDITESPVLFATIFPYGATQKSAYRQLERKWPTVFNAPKSKPLSLTQIKKFWREQDIITSK